MSIWIILSWVGVLVLTVINVVLFLKLKQASEQMLKMAFPGAKNMNEALGNMQQMMAGMNRGGAGARGGTNPFGGGMGGKSQDAQLKAAMDMLAQIQKKNKR